MYNIKISIQYDGTNYNGWQKQVNAITIQDILQEKISLITSENIKIIGAGRTDRGVHAIEQIACFKTLSTINPDIFKKAINALLPPDIRITDCSYCKDSFHPRYDAKSKIYFYLISLDKIISPFIFKYVHSIPYSLDIETIERSLQILKGTNDFSSFRASGCGAKNSIRTIFDISIQKTDFMTTQLNETCIKITIEADGFLRHMVRNIIGTLIEIGRGKIDFNYMEKILNSKNRTSAGPTAPAKGLFLYKVNY